MRSAELLNKRVFQKPRSDTLRKRVLSMITFLMGQGMLSGDVRLEFINYGYVRDKRYYNGFWKLKFNRCQRYFINLFSAYFFLKDVMEKLKQ